MTPFNCEILAAYVNDETGFVAGSSNWTILLKRKGILGTGTDQVASLTTTAGSTAYLPVTLGTITNSLIPNGTAVSLTMTKNSGANTHDTVVSIVYREI